ncbi:FAD-dependent monooxygenase [Burkholderia cenocepacia]|uniref:FAD-dependent oxidoreductase n=1 Tax=Burkholderia cenocepacia TaxID=95486 RepID=UPI000F585BA6|nr:NAD(P)/FAD-dependent oxidoreductase [Burkholderia cenocepacia]RQU23777.1 FAD-dependent monooxygenase [Burkholderia cenocepacia]RQU34051.1 FAD-dependent monooxygenase [Burkholderia cenocepacia]RQU61849.1 FAD-dependent monooxygenase [Burkholderia cenocepacia]
MKPGFRIAIVGGGPGGLTLARLLSLGGIDAVVYERDAHPLERPQGGTLDLHEESGLLALARAGLTDAFLAVARYEDQGSRLLDRTGRVLFDDDGIGGNRPEVDRTALRALLLDALPPGAVQWGRTVREVLMAPDGRATLVFEHGTEGPFDLVVGADGAWSRLRPLLSPYQPQYSGLTFIEFGIDDIDRRHPALSRLVGRGKVGVFGGGKAIIAQRNGHAHVRGYAIFRVPLDWVAQRFDFASPDAMRAALVAEFDGCADAIHDLFRASGDRFANRPIVALPVGHCWAHRRGVTLIGDAAHVMSPFGGEGVNNAMRDAAELAAGLIAHADRDTAVAAFEQQMFVRVTESAREAADAAATQLSHDAEALALARYRALHAA